MRRRLLLTERGYGAFMKFAKFILSVLFCLPVVSFASGGYPSLGNDIICAGDLDAGNDQVIVDFKVLKGNLSDGVSGVITPVLTKATSATPAVLQEIKAIVKDLYMKIGLAYKDKVFKINFTSKTFSTSETHNLDMTLGKRYASISIDAGQIGVLQDGTPLLMDLYCGARTIQDKNR